MAITHKSKLPVGIQIDGNTVKDFTVRPATMRDNIAAIEELGDDAPQISLRIAIQARQVSFDGSDEVMTTDMLMDAYEADYSAIADAIGVVEKKLLA
jgi:hypothetical protein